MEPTKGRDQTITDLTGGVTQRTHHESRRVGQRVDGGADAFGMLEERTRLRVEDGTSGGQSDGP